jgi:hypothetical protein
MKKIKNKIYLIKIEKAEMEEFTKDDKEKRKDSKVK